MDPGATLRRDDNSPEEVRNAAGDSARRFGKFIRLEQVGRGGWGEVWRAWETGLGRFVAIKTLTGSVAPEDRERFLREARMAAKLAHPNIVAIHEQGTIDGVDYISMHFVAGRPLSKLRLPMKEGLAVMRDAARAVEVAHQQGLVHRDLKPANIMVEEKTGRAYVLDFGLARSVREGTSISVSGAIMGTPAYMAPEQAEGHVHVDARADVYGLGATLYEVVTGQPPFEGESILDILRKVEFEEPLPPRRLNPRLDADVETIIQKAMEKESARRYATAADFADDIDRFLRGEPISARPASLLYKLRKKIQRQPVAWALAALLVAAIIGGAAFGAVQVRRAIRERDQRLAAEKDRLKELEMREAARPRLDAARKLIARVDLMLREETPDPAMDDVVRQACQRLGEALKAYPNHPEAHLERGRLFRMMDKKDDALKSLNKALEASPRLATARLERALLKLERYEEMRHEATGKLRTENPVARRFREDVERDLRAVREWSEDEGDLNYADGLMAFATGDFEGTARLLRKYLKHNPNDAEGWYWLGHGLHDLNQREEAIVVLTRSIKNRPGYWPAYAMRGATKVGLGDLAGSIQDSTKAIDLNKDCAEAYLNRGGAKGRLGDDRGEIEDCTKTIELRPDLAVAYANRASAKGRLGDDRGAIEDYTKAIEFETDYAQAYQGRATAKSRLGDDRGTIEDNTKAIDLNGNDAKAYCCRGWSKKNLGDDEGAIVDFTSTIKLNPDYELAYANRGASLHALGRWAEALTDFKKAVELRPELEPQLRDRIRECEEKIKKGEDY